MLLIEGLDFETTSRQDFVDLKELAGELAAEVWLSISSSNEQIAQLPPHLSSVSKIW